MEEISRVTRSKAEAKTSYNRMSRWYDITVGWTEKKFRDAGLQKLDARDGERILEIGFGTGHCILSLAQAVGTTGRIYGLDLSEGMIDVTRKRINKAGFSATVELKCGDAARDIPYEDNLFDAIFMSATLELFDINEIPAVLQECKRVLRKGGRICIAGSSKKGSSKYATRIYEWMHAKFPNYVDCRPIFVQKSMEDAGFDIVDSTIMHFLGFGIEIIFAREK